MASDSFDININGLGSSTRIGGIDTTPFQDSLTKLTSSLKDANSSIASFTNKMKDAEQKLSASLKSGLNPAQASGAKGTSNDKPANPGAKTSQSFDARFFTSMDKLVLAMDKLGDKFNRSKPPSKPKPTGPPKEPPKQTPQELAQEVKKVLGAVGAGSILKSIIESNIVNPAKNTGYLISSNILQNPSQVASNLVASTLKAQSNTTTALLTGAGVAIGGAVGGFGGAAIGYGAGQGLGNLYGQTKNAIRIPTAERLFQQSFENNYINQNPRLKSLMNNTYGGQDLNSTAVYSDPNRSNNYAFNRSFGQFSTQNVDTANITSKLSTAGFGTPGEASQFGHLLGQIAKFTGKNSEATNNIFKNIEKSGVNPFDQAQKALNLFQAGLGTNQVNSILSGSANQTTAFSQAQQNFLGQNPLSRLNADLTASVFGVDAEKFANNDKATINKVRSLKAGANLYNSTHGKRGNIRDVVGSAVMDSLGLIVAPTGGEENRGGASLNDSETQKKLKGLAVQSYIEGLNGQTPGEAIKSFMKDLSDATSNFRPKIEGANEALDIFSFRLKYGVFGDNGPPGSAPLTLGQQGKK